MLRGRRGWRVKSNREAGMGRAVILLTDRVRRCGHIIEAKYSKSAAALKERAMEGLRQIEDRVYDEYFGDQDISVVYHYGIAFHQKRCVVVASGEKPVE
ncbi:MAG: PD-(D/E)XK nuclease domain-containing protein [Clostridiales bacterium]|nr:PD-(D/E)XK nuclease domain-containing protein [Clostridiales bacterium]